MRKKILILVLFLLQCSLSHSQPGQIDNSFNSSGVGAYGGTPPPAALDGSADGNVYKSAVYVGASNPNKDKIIIIGRLTSYNGVARKYIARLNPDGTLDETWVAPTLSSGYLYCVTILSNNKVLIGGSFTVSGGGFTYRNIARLNADGSLDTTFIPLGIGVTRGAGNGEVHAISVYSNRVFVGGTFTLFNGQAKSRIVKLNTDGTTDATFVGSFNGEVRAIAFQTRSPHAGKVLVGGFFEGTTSHPTAGRIVRLTTTGDLDTTFNNGAQTAWGGSAVFDILVVPYSYYAGSTLINTERIYAGGKFATYNAQVSRSIVRLNASGEKDFVPVGLQLNDVVFSIKAQPDGKLLLGGNLDRYNSTATVSTANETVIPKGIARISADGILDTTFLTGAGFNGGTTVYEGSSVVRDIVLQSDGKIIVGGDYLTYDNTPRRMIARIKTRECFNAAVYDSGWDNNIIPTNDTYYMVVVSGTLTIPTNTHMIACELEIKPGATLIIEEKASLTVKGIVMNNGTFHIDNAGSLVQIKEDAVNADLGTGVFTMIRKTTPVKKFDFTYWCSPVEQQTLFNLSPETLSDKYYEFKTATNTWANPVGGSSATMADGKGYIIRAPQTFSTTVPSVYTATFQGKPHNGLVKATITKNGFNSWNLIGNPYPSAIDADLFLDANVTKIGGSMYLWTHNTAVNPSTGAYQYTSDDYAVYNKTGNINTSPTNAPFEGKIASGQGFFVEGLVTNGFASFTNAMRVTSENENNSQFYRMSNETASVEEANVTVTAEKHRLWINLTNAQGAYKQTLVAFASGATNDFDRSFDAKVFNANSYVNLYSISNSQNLAIQGRALPFDSSEVIPLGYSSTIAGTFSIVLDHFDGLFQNEPVYLLDKLTNTVHNLKQSAYSFTTATGTFNERFELRFMGATDSLSTNDALLANEGFVVLSQNRTASLKSTIAIESVEIYDVAGKLLMQQSGIDSTDFTSSDLNAENNVIVIKAILSNQQEVVRKLILR